MPKQPANADLLSWTRFFAVTANNTAWNLAEQPIRDEGALEDLLSAAHAAAYHWKAVGTPLQVARARLLVAQAHALAGLGTTALAYARAAESGILGQEEVADWERCLLHAILAHAAAVAGQPGAHAEHWRTADAAFNRIADAEDREITARTWLQVPRPALA